MAGLEAQVRWARGNRSTHSLLHTKGQRPATQRSLSSIPHQPTDHEDGGTGDADGEEQSESDAAADGAGHSLGDDQRRRGRECIGADRTEESIVSHIGMNALKHSGKRLHLVGAETLKSLRIAVPQDRAPRPQSVQRTRRQ